ncbi:hypothetical protein M5D96_006512 [Drosophila gunungcola]|uniref:Uncharacterized protein n=1 Tax=Drosophila gunungcola TaxID=103775 RepID=A0A9P9YP49_9MUSC|nr:hypothetical protein M5D96_006512 [Drosophila gunungcola]
MREIRAPHFHQNRPEFRAAAEFFTQSHQSPSRYVTRAVVEHIGKRKKYI